MQLSEINLKILYPLVLVGGEELHNNHHASPASPKLSKRWFEFDIGWLYLYILRKLHLAKIKQ